MRPGIGTRALELTRYDRQPKFDVGIYKIDGVDIPRSGNFTRRRRIAGARELCKMSKKSDK